LNEYEKHGIMRKLKRDITEKMSIENILNDLSLRNKVISLYKGDESLILKGIILNFEKKREILTKKI